MDRSRKKQGESDTCQKYFGWKALEGDVTSSTSNRSARTPLQ